MGDDGEVNPVEFGKLLQAVETLTANVRELKSDVDGLKSQLTGGKGLIAGLMVAAGGIGASAKHVLESILK